MSSEEREDSPSSGVQANSDDESSKVSAASSDSDVSESPTPKKSQKQDPSRPSSSSKSSSNASSPARAGSVGDNKAEGSADEAKDSDGADSDSGTKALESKVDQIFGNAISSESEGEGMTGINNGSPADEELRRRGLGDSSDEESQPQEKVIMNDQIPLTRTDLGERGPHFVRLPNFLSINPKPFNSNPDAYEAEVDDDDVFDEEGRARLKLRIENTIRWRWIRDPETGDYKRQSNAKLVRWSDGTQSLYLGNEIFEVQEQPAMPNMHLFTRIGPVLQAQAIFKKKYTFRPHSTDTVTHRKLTMNMADKSNKGPKVKLVNEVGMNPEKQRREMVKKEEESARAAQRKLAQQRRSKERAREVGLTSGFIEDEGDIAAIKNRYKQPARPYFSDDSEEDERNRKVLRDAKIISSDSDDEPTSSQRQPRKHRIVDDDED